MAIPELPTESEAAEPLDMACTPALGPETALASGSPGQGNSPTAPAEAPQLVPPQVGETFDRYEILGCLGKGGMGQVFKAHDPALDRVVALKTIRTGLFANATEVERFQKEARAVAKLRHQNIVTVFDFGEYRGQHFFTMEYVPGGRLDPGHYVQAPPREAAAQLAVVARAIHYAHERNVLHRDLKPANIFIDENGAPRVGDFGLVKFLDEEEDTSGRGMGTLAYMSPEQAAGLDEKLSPAADVWALGVVLFEMLTGARPFQATTTFEMRQLIGHASPPRPRQLRKNLDRDLEAIVLKCLQKAPEDRYASAIGLAEDLEHWLEHKPVEARPLGRLERAYRSVRRHPLRVAMALLLLLALGGAGLVMELNREPGDEPIVDQEAALAEIDGTLKEGKPATLIAETGGPKFFHVLENDPEPELVRKRGRIFQLASKDWSFIELLTRPLIESYRFRAQMRHVKGTKDGKAGLYFARQIQPMPSKSANLLLCFGANDCTPFHEKPDPKTPGSLMKTGSADVRSLLETWDRQYYMHGLHTGMLLEFDLAKTPGGQWRQLEVLATTEKFQVFLDGKALDDAQLWKAWNDAAKTSLDGFVALGAADGFRAVAPNHALDQGLGVFVLQSTAEFKNVVIEPVVWQP